MIFDLTITTENEGTFLTQKISEIQDYLINIAEVSINDFDFIRKCTFGLTDETNSLSKKDQETLLIFLNNH